MSDAIVVLNAGSSSIKFSLFLLRADSLELFQRGQVEGLATAPRFVAKDARGAQLAGKSWDAAIGHEGALDHLVAHLRSSLEGHRLAGVGHRVVHGGMEYTQPVLVDRGVVRSLEQFVPLAPLHQPHNLSAIRLLLERLPQLPQVACFDTSFHRSNPEIAQMFALPAELHLEGVRRYGFHGLSYEYISSVLPGSMRTRRPAAPWCCTWATAPACARWKAGAASPAPWASPRWTACPWARAAARSTPA
jgi:acetate kinase